ncbi:MAG TPA: hypothetical protein VHC94_06275 [Nitrobacter sp.]|jgi:transposase|nr:hypothetical protein [Nitrobacter sp.]
MAEDIQAAAGENIEIAFVERRWLVKRTFAWATRFRRLVKDYERCAATLANMHIIAFVGVMLKSAAKLTAGS